VRDRAGCITALPFITILFADRSLELSLVSASVMLTLFVSAIAPFPRKSRYASWQRAVTRPAMAALLFSQCSIPDISEAKFCGRKELRFPLPLRATCDQLYFSTKLAGRSAGPELKLTGNSHARNISRQKKDYYSVRRALRPRSERSIRLLAQ
jgi:hypothetical protein